MQVSEQGIALIRKYEGFSAKAYICPAGKRTIGYGHVIRAGEQFAAAGITEQQAESLLIQDVGDVSRVISKLLKIGVNQHQFDALVSFAYNIGIGAFEKSTLLRLLNAGDAATGQQFGRWVYVDGQKFEGLVARRAEEAALFNT